MVAPRALLGPVFACAVALFLIPAALLACDFDMVKPQKTMIDRIVEADRLVLARPRADDPFRFEIVDVLHGKPDAAPIDHLVDTATRHRLAAAPMDAVLFAKEGEDSWRRVTTVDETVRPILQTALAHRAEWQAGMPQSRVDYIEALQTDADAFRKRLVISELDKVPYDQLRAFDLQIPVQDLRADLWSVDGYPYQAILALLVGLSGSPEAEDEINAYILRVEDWPWAENLGAFAAAFIELHGAKGVEHLSRAMLLDPAQPLDKLEQIVMAYSVHYGLAEPALQAALSRSIQALLAARPEAAASVARQFSLRSDWSQSAALAPLVAERKLANLNDLLTVSVYVARARETEASQ